MKGSTWFPPKVLKITGYINLNTQLLQLQNEYNSCFFISMYVLMRECILGGNVKQYKREINLHVKLPKLINTNPLTFSHTKQTTSRTLTVPGTQYLWRW